MCWKLLLCFVTFSYLVHCQYEYKHYYDGYTLKKDPKPFESVKFDFDQDNAPSDPDAPQLTYTLLGHTFNSSEAKIKFDVRNMVIYLLTFKMVDGAINDSNLFVSTTMGSTYEEIDLKYNDKDIVVTDIYVAPGVIVAVANFAKIVSTSINYGKTWNQVFTYNPTREILINFLSPFKIALVTTNNILYISSNNGSRWYYKSSGAYNYTWEYGSTYFYYLEKVKVGTVNPTTRLDLYRCSPEQNYATLMIRNVYKFGAGYQLLWVVVNNGSELNLKVSTGTDAFRDAVFPKKLKIKDYFIQAILLREILATIVNDANQIYLYSAALADLKFWRMDDDVGAYYDASKPFCVDMESFFQLPGVLMGQKIKGSAVNDQPYTAISYSHGTKWVHVTAPKLINGKKCEWPTCYLRIHMRCTATGTWRPITTVEGAPAVMVAHGVIVRVNEPEVPGIFISTDAGKTWIRAIKNIHSYTVMDKGGVIFAYPEYSYTAFFSYDFGLSWKSINMTANRFRALGTFHDPSSVSLVAATVGYDEDTMDWSIIRIDFNIPVEKSCNLNDYEVFTPGSTKNDQCYQGKKNSFYKRKHNVTCRSIIGQLPPIQNIPCPCTQDDFGCAFGYYLKNGDCVIDPDHVPDENITCKIGEFYLRPSSKAKFIGDVCTANGSYVDEESEICQFTDNDDVISILVGSVLKFINLNNGKVSNLTKVPVDFKTFGNVLSYDVDHSERCVYYLNSSGIVKLCWNVREEVISKNEKFFLRDLSIIGIKIDDATNNMYFYNNTFISVINVFSRYRATIVKSDRNITYFNLFPSDGFMVYATTLKNSQSLLETTLIVSTLNGERMETITIKEKIYTVSYNSTDKKLLAYGEDVYYIMNIDGSSRTTKPHTYKGIINAYIVNSTIYVVTESYISIPPSTLISHNHISNSDLHLVDYNPGKHPCSLASCKYLCFSDLNNGYKCGCPDTMEFSIEQNDCVCDSLHPACKECDKSEFHCENQKCVDLSARCNGVDNCGDNSDEANCTLVCQADEFSCDSNTKCIDIIQRCDGVNDCADGTDEVGCDVFPSCQPNEFQCVNSKCIPAQKYCDGVDDCGDYSDEDSCSRTDCRFFEVKCDNGECILPSQICDGVFDCSDWSDEKDCGSRKNSANSSCVIKCDDKCIPSEKMCDHITDCVNGEDELDCVHYFTCPLPNQEKCTHTFACYDASRKCDGFAECDDGSDESDCPEYNYCSDPESFKCDQDNRCLSVNRVCDGVVDCDDKSDENQKCLNEATIKSIQIDRRGASDIDISWSVANIKRSTAFNVTLIPKAVGSVAVSYTLGETSMTIPGLDECSLYTVYVRVLGGISGRAIEFVARRNNNGVPTDAYYYYSNSVLEWKRVFSNCIPETFYVECTANNDTVYRNFTTSTSIVIKYNSDAVCKLSSCVASIFNYSCSDFTPTLRMSSSISSASFLKYGLPILLVLALIGAGAFVYYRFLRGANLSSFLNFFKRKSNFTKLQAETVIDSRDLLEEGETDVV